MFFVATNHLETVDPAAQRPGRFDLRLQIMPPSFEEKLRMARDCLGPELFAAAEADLRRKPYRTNLRLASRNEMLSLCEEIKRHPERMEETLSQFRAELIGDERFGDPAGSELHA
jgi:SpoVK/Ycf46/Vps4 family AAA+-type ATPase